MSLDNAIAVLSLVANDSGKINHGGFLIVFAGLAVSVPILLITSGLIIRLINKYAVVFALCVGYLAYIAMRMILEDSLFEMLFKFNHTSIIQIAISVFIGYIIAITAWQINIKTSQSPQ
jgi:predicted tellurium resistance membrane protein TerC